MEPLTLAVAALASILVWFARPIHGLCIYLCALCFYPQYLAVSIGSIDFSTSRIVILVFLTRIILTTPLPRKFRLTWIDVFVVATAVAAVLALFTNAPALKVIERQGGTFFDTVLPYFAVRLTLRSREDLITFMQTFVLIGIPLAILGAIQSVTGFNLYDPLRAHGTLGVSQSAHVVRYGFVRADGSFGEKISFGLFFVAAVALCAGLVSTKRWSVEKAVFVGLILCAGALSSMSSAPLLALVVGLGVLACYPVRRFWPYVAAAVAAGIFAVELYSDRHFYHVLDHFAYNSSTAYYRIGLLDETFGGGMDGHWLTGYGYVGVGPGNDNTHFNWRYTDLVNIYIAKLVRTGIVGTIPFLLLNLSYYWYLYRAGRIAHKARDRWLVWSIATALVAWNVAMMTVGALGQIQVLLRMIIAVACNIRLIMHAESLADSTYNPESDDPASRQITNLSPT